MSGAPGEGRPRCVLVDDEPAPRERLRDLLALAWPELLIVDECDEGYRALRMLNELKPEFVFLDINIPGLNGLDLAWHAPRESHIVFTTAFDAHAMDAFDRGAIDYLLKPIDVQRFLLTIQRLKDRAREPGPAPGAFLPPPAPGRKPLRWIVAGIGRSSRMINVNDVIYFQSEHKYTRVILADCEFLIRKSIRELLPELDPDQFWQIHRSTVVNLEAVVSIEADLRGRPLLKMKGRRELLAISETYQARFRQM